MTEPKRNIALVINDLKGNGAERVVITLANGFIEAGHRASIICFKRHIELPVPESIPVHIFSEKKFRWIPRRLRGLLAAPWLDRFIKKHAGTPDLVLSFLIPADRVMAYSKLENVHFVIQNTLSLEVASYFPETQRAELAKRREIYARKPSICASYGVETDMKAVLGSILSRKITTIHNPIDPKQVEETACEIPEDIIPNAIICVGKFKEQKRQDRLIRAFAAIDCEEPLVFIGQGPLMQEAKDLAKQLDIKERVHFMGFRKNPYPYMKAAKLHVLCSDYEGLGVVILESICLKTPTISSDCPSGPSEILPRENLFETDNLNDFIQLLQQAIKTPDRFQIPLDDQFTTGIAIEKYLRLIA